jgi:hypothetical protein
MTARIASLATLIFVAVSWPAPAAACGCVATVPSSTAARGVDVVFLGTVTRIDSPPPRREFRQNSDGSISVDASPPGPDLVMFDVAHVFKGPPVTDIGVVNSKTTCGFAFTGGEEWLICGDEAMGGIAANKCARTRLSESATQDLVYLRGAQAKRPQGIVYGQVLRAPDRANNVRRAVLEQLQVIAASATQKFTTTTKTWGPFELVLPPGDFEGWAEGREKPVAQKRVVHVGNGAEVRVQLRAEYSDGDR